MLIMVPDKAADIRRAGKTPPFCMAKIRYLQRTHDSFPGDEKSVNDQCAKVLVLLGNAEYISNKRAGGRSNNKKAAGTG